MVSIALNHLLLNRYHLILLSKVEGRIENVEEVAGAIKRAIKKSGAKARDAAMAVSVN
jgi:Tfp pilus assembly PilM family ATPase